MSSGPNHRRGHGRIQGNGPRYENANPEAGCNSTHVARARRKWQNRARRSERRNGQTSSKVHHRHLVLPEVGDEE
jgi:hypothetical protein